MNAAVPASRRVTFWATGSDALGSTQGASRSGLQELPLISNSISLWPVNEHQQQDTSASGQFRQLITFCNRSRRSSQISANDSAGPHSSPADKRLVVIASQAATD